MVQNDYAKRVHSEWENPFVIMYVQLKYFDTGRTASKMHTMNTVELNAD